MRFGKRQVGRPVGSFLTVCPGSGKLRFAEARRSGDVVICPECGRALSIQRWDGKEPGIPVHRALKRGTYVSSERGRKRLGLQEDHGAPQCPQCGQALEFHTNGNGLVFAECPLHGPMAMEEGV